MLQNLCTFIESDGIGQGPLSPLDIRWMWLWIALAVAAALLGLLIWRLVVGWKERNADRQAEKSVAIQSQQAESATALELKTDVSEPETATNPGEAKE